MKEIEDTSNKKINIWTRTKTLIKSIEIEETNNRKRQIQRAKRLIRNKLKKEIRLFKDIIAKRKKIGNLTKRINESKRT